MPKTLTVIVPSYDMEAYLPKCLGSLVIDDKELFNSLDVIVVNDGSKDRTGEIAHGFEAKYPGVFRIIDKENGHYGSCINAALPVAEGEYVKVLDADDTFDTEGLKGFVAYLQTLAGSGVDIVLSDAVMVRPNGTTRRCGHHTLREGVVYPTSALTTTRGSVFNPGLTYRTALLREIGYRQMEGVCYSDTQWYLVPLCHAKTLSCFPHVIYRYLVGRDGQSMSRIQYASNTWMMERVAMDLLNNYGANTAGADERIARHYRHMIYETLLSIYVAQIIWRERELSKTDLRALDEKLKREAPDIYDRIGRTIWSWRGAPFRYVRAWRNRSPLLPAIAWLCRAQSRFAAALLRRP